LMRALEIDEVRLSGLGSASQMAFNFALGAAVGDECQVDVVGADGKSRQRVPHIAPQQHTMVPLYMEGPDIFGREAPIVPVYSDHHDEGGPAKGKETLCHLQVLFHYRELASLVMISVEHDLRRRTRFEGQAPGFDRSGCQACGDILRTADNSSVRSERPVLRTLATKRHGDNAA